MRIFEFDQYKDYVLVRIKAMPQAGRGEFQKIAHALKMHTTLVSQVFRGKKDLTLEQACALADYFSLTELETEYFICLVQLERAGTDRLRRMLKRQRTVMREKGLELGQRIQPDKALTGETKAIFYSNWYYSGVWLLTSIPKYQDVESISKYFDLPEAQARRIVEFLLNAGLCAEQDGRITMVGQRTHLEANSPLISRHHLNWRMKAMSRFENLSPDELVFSAPMSIAVGDGPVIREALAKLIETVASIVKNTASEKVSCLNIDWFNF